MRFEQALRQLRKGLWIRRAGWKRGAMIALVRADLLSCEQARLCWHNGPGVGEFGLITSDAILGDDWEVVPEGPKTAWWRRTLGKALSKACSCPHAG